MELLKQLYCIHSMSGQEGAMRKFVKTYVKNMHGDITLRQDHGNIYITKGDAESYPCLIAHLDQVQTKHSKDFRVFETDGRLFGFSFENRRLEGLGADDKNGIWIALKCLETAPALKVAFFKEEETGCGGSRVADMDFFKDCRYCIQADRRNGGDLITEIGWTPICSREFVDAIQLLADKHGYKEESGLMTDVETIVDRGVGISCINISCGYYDPHTDNESTDIKELNNALAFVQGVISSVQDTYAHTPPQEIHDYYTRAFYGAGKYSDYYEVEVPDYKDYNYIEEWLEDFIWYNGEFHTPEDLWPYVSADCDAFGISEEEFYAMYDSLFGTGGGSYRPQWDDECDDLSLAYAG